MAPIRFMFCFITNNMAKLVYPWSPIDDYQRDDIYF